MRSTFNKKKFDCFLDPKQTLFCCFIALVNTSIYNSIPKYTYFKLKFFVLIIWNDAPFTLRYSLF